VRAKRFDLMAAPTCPVVREAAAAAASADPSWDG